MSFVAAVAAVVVVFVAAVRALLSLSVLFVRETRERALASTSSAILLFTRTHASWREREKKRERRYVTFLKLISTKEEEGGSKGSQKGGKSVG